MEYKIPYYEWNMAAVLMNEIGKKLQAARGEDPLQKSEIEAEIISTGIYKPQSLFPSDYCYNLINKDKSSFRFPLFIWLKWGTYLHVGPYYQYSGPVLWKGKQVGEWENGAYKLWEDPRQ
jgi:hypothetical protein